MRRFFRGRQSDKSAWQSVSIVEPRHRLPEEMPLVVYIGDTVLTDTRSNPAFARYREVIERHLWAMGDEIAELARQDRNAAVEEAAYNTGNTIRLMG